jgi:hypothetical protein
VLSIARHRDLAIAVLVRRLDGPRLLAASGMVLASGPSLFPTLNNMLDLA